MSVKTLFDHKIPELLWLSRSAYASFFRWILVILISLISWFCLITAITAAFGFLLPEIVQNLVPSNGLQEQNRFNYPVLYALFNLALYVPALNFSLWIVKLPLRRVINPKGSIAFDHILMAALMTLIMASLSIAFYYYQGNEIKFNRWDQEQALFALACFCIIIFQASAEELLFRGVIIQCLGKLTRNFWLLLIIPSLLFWAAHQGNSEVDEIGHAAQFFYIGFSLILTALTLLTGRLEYSIGMHIANNLFVFLLVNNTAYPITTNPIGLFEFSQKLNMPDLFITLGLFTITALLILSFAKIGRK